MNNLYDLFCEIDKLTDYLTERNFEFTEDGLPIFRRAMFLEETPDLMIPVNHRKNRRVKNPERTVIVFFCGDKFIYRRIDKLLDEIDEYKSYMGVVEPDVTVTADMDIEWQKTIILFNQLIMAVFAVNDIKIVLNSRMGCKETISMFSNIPKGISVASGFLGGDKRGSSLDNTYVAKILGFMPTQVLVYGPCNENVMNKMKMMGLKVNSYSAFRKLCREVA